MRSTNVWKILIGHLSYQQQKRDFDASKWHNFKKKLEIMSYKTLISIIVVKNQLKEN